MLNFLAWVHTRSLSCIPWLFCIPCLPNTKFQIFVNLHWITNLDIYKNKDDFFKNVSFHFHRVKSQEPITLKKINKLYTLEKWTKKRLKKYVIVVLMFDTLGMIDNFIMRCFERCIPSVIKSIDIFVHVFACHDKFVCHHLIWIDRGPINDKLTFNYIFLKI